MMGSRRMDRESVKMKWIVWLAGLLLYPLLGWGSGTPILIGLDADLSSGSARSGEAIRRGAELAIEEINQQGGVLGRPLQLITRDHRGNPARGVDNVKEFAAMPTLVAIMGGLHTPVAMKELKTIHRERVPFLIPWAAGTPVIDNGYQPNYVFRVSVRDQYAGGFLVGEALSKGYTRIGLLLERTGWGRSNQKAMTEALERQQRSPVVTEWFHWGEQDFAPVLEKMYQSGAEAILMVANAPEGKSIVQGMSQRPQPQRMPIFSHWGVTGGTFHQSVGHLLQQVDLQFLQSYSFLQPTESVISARVVEHYCARYGCGGVDQPEKAIFAPVGTAHAYDLIHLLKMAIEQVGSVESSVVRDALEQLPHYRGLVREYRPPFTPTMHDALSAEDFRMARFAEDGAIVPQP